MSSLPRLFHAMTAAALPHGRSKRSVLTAIAAAPLQRHNNTMQQRMMYHAGGSTAFLSGGGGEQARSRRAPQFGLSLRKGTTRSSVGGSSPTAMLWLGYGAFVATVASHVVVTMCVDDDDDQQQTDSQ